MATRDLNKVMLIGNLTRDPEIRYTPQGSAVVNFTVATNRSWNVDGQQKEAVDFHNIVAWGKLAELCAQLLKKGTKVYVEGRLQTRTWAGTDNVKKYKTEVSIDEMIVLTRGKTNGEESATGEAEDLPEETGSDDIDIDDLLADIENETDNKN